MISQQETFLPREADDAKDNGFEAAGQYSELAIANIETEPHRAMEDVLDLVSQTRNYCDLQDRKKNDQVADPSHLREVAQALHDEYLDNSDSGPEEREAANTVLRANFDRETGRRLEAFSALPQHDRDDESFRQERGLKLQRARFDDLLRQMVGQRSDMKEHDLQMLLKTATGDSVYAKSRVDGVAKEVATYEALMDMPELRSVRYGTPEEDLMGRDLVTTVTKGAARLPTKVYFDVKSSRPKDAERMSAAHDSRNGNIRVWLPIKTQDFRWVDPEAVREYYRDQILGPMDIH